jgi:hypothetical protein
MGFDVVIDAGVNKETAIWNDGAGAQPFLFLQKQVLRSSFIRQNKQQQNKQITEA